MSDARAHRARLAVAGGVFLLVGLVGLAGVSLRSTGLGVASAIVNPFVDAAEPPDAAGTDAAPRDGAPPEDAAPPEGDAAAPADAGRPPDLMPGPMSGTTVVR